MEARERQPHPYIKQHLTHSFLTLSSRAQRGICFMVSPSLYLQQAGALEELCAGHVTAQSKIHLSR
jgi:hypothetical protein